MTRAASEERGPGPARSLRANPFAGTWRIVETDVWDGDALDLVALAHIAFRPNGSGELGMIAIEAEVDYRVGSREGLPCVEFSWCGETEGDLISGRGWAALKNGRLEGRLFIHQGDDSSFLAERRGDAS
ncbi:MAG TPA: hypothetical protein VFI25_14030 [Planctomycetota bacterium]|jgi:hypothetical protein|nr:hypothetical protein [Planctomycetota bacterium]